MAAQLKEEFDKSERWLGDPRLQEPEKTPFWDAFGVMRTIEEWNFQLWQSIRQGVGGNGFGPGSITWGDLVAYERFASVTLPSLTVNLVLIIDQAYLSAYRPPGQPTGA